MTRWDAVSERVRNPDGEVVVAVVGKYPLKDAYKSLVEALGHGGIANNKKVSIDWVDAEQLEEDRDLLAAHLGRADGILVPGGFGKRGSEGKILAARFARERQVPYFGICLGMQMAVVEAARGIAGVPGAGSSEFGSCDDPVVGLMREWARGTDVEARQSDGDLGGTMRLGAYLALLKPGSHVASIYNAIEISERHRHRYEVNTSYRSRLEEAGMTFSGMSPDGLLPETVELRDHPWFVGVQFHPELKSRPFEPHPLFTSFVAASVDRSRLI